MTDNMPAGWYKNRQDTIADWLARLHRAVNQESRALNNFELGFLTGVRAMMNAHDEYQRKVEALLEQAVRTQGDQDETQTEDAAGKHARPVVQ